MYVHSQKVTEDPLGAYTMYVWGLAHFSLCRCDTPNTKNAQLLVADENRNISNLFFSPFLSGLGSPGPLDGPAALGRWGSTRAGGGRSLLPSANRRMLSWSRHGSELKVGRVELGGGLGGEEVVRAHLLLLIP